ncbi:MAG: AAA family ATPase [Armatimonadota bacterium]|nr:AAA family ATPase [Armatimonadota bacterium]MDR7451788.1 AAA family ATPase [Armatimonadota bacterium]MDR7467413.1 AAA family ATPase [Armatimonadota bacterium]MDR7494183.1 AAA family ATPase [Armatimonadota bacterium]MDR7498851.1 AAA family ATPase [Armatimonadota bacterium]
MIVAIAGPIGVGKSTVARALADRLGYRYISGGEVFRQIARERGISVVEVNRLAETDPELDRALDRRQAELARAGNCVVESRLSGWMVEADLKVWLRAPVEVRAARVARREGLEVTAALRELVERERSEWARYKALYGIDIDDLTPYQLVIDTTRWSAEVIADALATLARTLLLETRTP